MTPEQKKLARHALGLPNDRKRSYRNRFFAGPADTQQWDAMVEAGEAHGEKASARQKDEPVFFWLTFPGARRALEPGETLCSEDFPEVA